MDLATGHPREWTLIVKQCVGDLKALWTLSKVPNIGAQMFWERFLRSSWSRYSSETQRHQSRGPKDLIMVDFWLVGLSVKYFDNGSTAKWSGWAQSKHHASPSTIQPSIPIDTEITSGMMALIGVAERAIGRRLPAWSQRSAFHSARARLAAQNLTMPALSPTMTEGSIASWKIKEGESYAAGDVLCEIETDKATMDVEAQEEGIMAKILYADGSKGVKVGTPIAVTAEEGDDLASLEMPGRSPPADATTAAGSPPHPADPTSAAPTKDNNTSHASAAPSASDQPPSPLHPGFSEPAPTARPPKPLLPSVLSLLAQYNLTPADAKSIEATGPQGRLTKGDVLAHLGQIPRSAPSDLTSAIKSREKLDLSNIRMRATGSTDPPAITDIYPGPRVGPAAPEKGSFAEPPSNIEVSLPISLKAVLEVQEKISRSVGIHLPLSTFIARATEIANEDLAVAHGQAPSQNELFDAVLGLDKVKGSMPLRSKGAFMPQMSALPPRRGGSSATAPASRGLSKRSDIFDILAGKKPTASRGPPRPAVKTGKDDASGPLNMFRVMASPRNEKQARTFLERIKTTLEAQPGRLIL